jgi:hypothetical protein
MAVSRSFGDGEFKAPTELISCKPDVKHYNIDEDIKGTFCISLVLSVV